MLNVEHLLDNAVFNLEKYEVHEAYRQFMESPCNIELAENAGIRLDDVWVMAVYCNTTLRQYWKEEWEKEAERWIPVTERLPDVPGHVLVWDNTAKLRKILWYHDCNGWGVEDKHPKRYFGNASNQRRYTHWMPLPEEPKEDVENV